MNGRLKKLKGVIFDFDGTLVSIHIDFKKIKKTLVERACKLGLCLPDGSMPILEMLDYVGKNNGNNRVTESFIADMKRILLEEETKSADKSFPLPGSIKLIKDLGKKGIRTGIFTRNCRQAVEKVVEKFSIPCDVLLTRDDVSKVKPAREHLEKAARLLGLTREEVLIAGDHPMDIRSARNFGALSCGIVSENINRSDFEREGADFIFDRIEYIGYLFGVKSLKTGKLPNSLLGYLLKTYMENDSSVIEGPQIGVDCAFFRTGSKELLVKTDPVTLVGKDTGNYLVNVNVNDISVMGGEARWFLCSLIFRRKVALDEIEDIFSQISDQCRKHGINWIGGHTEISGSGKSNIACGFLAGRMVKKKHMNCRGVKKGDKIFLVKELGIEAVSIIAREKYGCLKKYFTERALQKMINSITDPGISIAGEAKLLWENFRIKVMRDPTEGGISAALYEIAGRFNIGITVEKEKLVFNQYIRKLSSIYGLNPCGIISSGSIVGIISAADGPCMVRFLEERGIKCALIGEVTEGKGVYLRDGSSESVFPVFERDEINRI
ncbi:MAG TPA: HAD-IA family hydrolase [bacterium]|nr:HAD-IA family hydrolase [bacterium]